MIKKTILYILLLLITTASKTQLPFPFNQIPTSPPTIDSTFLRIANQLKTIRRSNFNINTPTFSRICFTDTSGGSKGLIFSFDTVANRIIVRRKPSTTDRQDMIIRNKIFNESVCIIGDSLNRHIIFENCLFEKRVVLVSYFNGQTLLANNIFLDVVQIGAPGILTYINEKISLQHNLFMQTLFVVNVLVKNTIEIDENYFNNELSFRKDICQGGKLEGSKNTFFYSIDFFNCDWYGAIDLDYNRFDQGIQMESSIFNDIKFHDCNFTKPTLMGMVFNMCRLQHGVSFNGSSIDSLSFVCSSFQKDSSYLSFYKSNIRKINFYRTSAPYLIDFNSATVQEKGFIDLLHMGDTTKEDMPNFLFGSINTKTLFYADSFDITKIKMDYKQLEIASTYYDPSITTFNRPLSILDATWGDTQDRVSSTLNVIIKNRQLPPYKDSLWRAKNIHGLVAKETAYKKIIEKLERENDIHGLEKATIEYQRFLLLERDPSFLNSIKYYTSFYWWKFGYERNRVIIWALALFLLFSILNTPMLGYLLQEIYQVENIRTKLNLISSIPSPVPPTHPNTHPRRLLHTLSSYYDYIKAYVDYLLTAAIQETQKQSKYFLLSSIYTGFIFFGVKMDADKFLHKRSLGTLWIFFVYTIGLVCTAFLINLIINH